MVVAGAGRTHRVEAVAVFDTRAGAANALAGGVPEIGVVESPVVTEFVTGDTGAETVVQPRTRRADVGQTRPAKPGHRTHANHVAVVIAQHVAGRRCRRPGVAWRAV